jgi:ribose transport system substrate-binding protein
MKAAARLVLVVVIGLVAVGALAQAQDRPVVGLVMKSLGNDFFQTMEAGAIAHAQERGDLELRTLGIQNETDLEAQINLVENLITQQVDAIVIAPADSRALVPILARAVNEGIEVVNIDVMLDDAALQDAGVEIPFVGPDNAAAAKMVGDVLAEHLGEGARVIILEGIPGADNAVQRARGFTQAAEEGNLEIVVSQTAHWETDEAFQLVSNLLTSNPDIDGIMASNDSMALGAVRAVESAGLLDQITIVGFDNIAAIQPLVCEGTVLATLDQFGAEQAAFGIDTAMEMLGGEERSGWVETDVQLITAEDLDCD